MGISPESNFIPPEKAFEPSDESGKEKGSSSALRRGADFWLNRFCKKLDIEGEENLDRIRQMAEKNSDTKFVIASSHFCDLDAPAAN